MVHACTISIVLEPKGNYEAHDDDRAYGKLVTAAWGLDYKWADFGLCRDYPAARDTTGWTWWMADTCDNTKPIPQRDKLRAGMAAMALMICRNCPVQYDCANYGVKSMASAGVYGVRTSNLQWLQKRGIDVPVGKPTGKPVEVWVNDLRHSGIV